MHQRLCVAREAAPTGTTASLRAHVDPVVGAWVRLSSHDHANESHRRFCGRADAAGHIRFEHVPSGTWRISAMAGFATASAQVQVDAGNDHAATLLIGDVRMVDVRVVDEQESPIEGAEVWTSVAFLGRIEPIEVIARRVATTDASGCARCLATSEELIGARKRGFAASLSIRAEEAANAPATLLLRRDAGSIDGVVVDERGRALAGATVYVAPIDRRSVPERTRDGRKDHLPVSIHAVTNEHGRFDVYGLAAGTYQCSTDPVGALYTEVEVEVQAMAPTPVRIDVRSSVRLHGCVVRADGVPAAGIVVHGFDPMGEQIAFARVTDEQGNFAFDVPAIGYRVDAVIGKKLLAQASSAGPLTGDAKVRLVVVEHLLASGTLLNNEGQPLADWRIVVMPDGEHAPEEIAKAAWSGRAVATDAAGHFAIWGADLGPFSVLALAWQGVWQGERPGAEQRMVRCGSRDLRLVVADEALPCWSVVGRIVDAAGNPVATAQIGSRDRKLSQGVATDGTFHLAGLRSGSCLLDVVAPGLASRQLKVVIDRRETLLGDVILQPAVVLQVRPVVPQNSKWLGPLPQPVIEHPDGSKVDPVAKPELLDGVFVFHDLPPGRYRLQPGSLDGVAARPLPFELRAGVPLVLDWPVEIGRRRVLYFAPDGARQGDSGAKLSVHVHNDAGDEVLSRDLVLGDRPEWVVADTFAFGGYQVNATSADGARYEGRFEVHANDSIPRVDVPRKR